MRLAILPFLFCAGAMAYCQSSSSGSIGSSSPLQEPSAAAPHGGFEDFSMHWQTGLTDSAKKARKPDSVFAPEWEKTQTPPQFQWPAAAEPSTAQLMAQNDSSVRSLLRNLPNAKGQPLDREWPNLKKEPIPTRWPKLQMKLIGKQAATPPAK